MGSPSRADFQSLHQETFAAIASVTGGYVPLTITATPLPDRAFFGKNAQIPIEITSPARLDNQNLTIEIVFQILDANGQALSPLNGIPVQTLLSPSGQNALRGSAIIPRSDLLGIRRTGTLHYFFRARQNGTDTVLTRVNGISRAPAGSPSTTAPSDPFEVAIIDTLRVPVGPQGAKVSVPDLFLNDGHTAVNFDPGVLSNPGFLTIHQEDVNVWPSGPRGLAPVEIYSFNLEDTALLRSAQLTFSYPSNLDGKVTDSNANPLDLAPFWWDSFEWRILSRPAIDTTLHTVTAIATHFSTFALFPSGGVASADLRPRERIITPNGDNVNDVACFGSGIEDIRIFDVRGRRIRTISGSGLMSGQLCGTYWDGRDDSGTIAESGVYVYQFTTEGERISGVITVAK
jgi:hypothetical protein